MLPPRNFRRWIEQVVNEGVAPLTEFGFGLEDSGTRGTVGRVKSFEDSLSGKPDSRAGLLNEAGNEFGEGGLILGGVDSLNINTAGQRSNGRGTEFEFGDVDGRIIAGIIIAGNDIVKREVAFLLSEENAEEGTDNGGREFGVAVAGNLLETFDGGRKERNASGLVGANVFGNVENVPATGIAAEEPDTLPRELRVKGVEIIPNAIGNPNGVHDAVAIELDSVDDSVIAADHLGESAGTGRKGIGDAQGVDSLQTQ